MSPPPLSPSWGLWLCVLLVCRTAGASDSPPVLAPARRADAPALVQLEVIRQPGAQSCEGPTELAQAVEARLGRRVFTLGEPPDLNATVRASHERERFVIVVSLSNRAGERLGVRRLSTRARDCSTLDDSLALVLALAADVRRDDPRLGSIVEPTTESHPGPPSGPLASPLSIPDDTLPRRPPMSLETRAGAALALGLLPHPTLGVELAMQLRTSHFWPLEFGVQVWHGQRLGQTRGVDFAVQGLLIGACPFERSEEYWHFSVCVEQALQLVHAQGFGFDRDRPAARWLPAVGAVASLTRELGPAFARLSASLLVPFVQRRYFYADGADVTLYRAPWLFGALSGSLGVRW